MDKKKRRGLSPASIAYFWAVAAAVIYKLIVPVNGLTVTGAFLDFVSFVGLLWVLFYLIIRAFVAQVAKEANKK